MNLINTPPRSIAVNPLSIIDRIILELELRPDMHKDATGSYEAVATVLAKYLPELKISIFPQGSMRKGTTILPIVGERFDLDMVCLIEMSRLIYTPEQVFNLVWEALGRDETYRQMRRKKNRCIQLKYHSDCKYDLDVVPAVSCFGSTGLLFVPDRERKEWCPSNPIGYCDNWFKKAAAVTPIIQPLLIRNRMSNFVMANEASAEIEPMPKFGMFEKTPLQRIVQMLKRSRDEYFQNDQTHRPSSILLTTVITHAYLECVGQPVEDLLAFVINVVKRMPSHISVIGNPPNQHFGVMNPVNAQENFAESWTTEHHSRFMAWHRLIGAGLEKLQLSKGLGGDVMLKRLSETFGNERVIRAAKSLGADANALHDAHKLCIAGGMVTTVGSKIPATINFGSK